jgi:hypothetical protein
LEVAYLIKRDTSLLLRTRDRVQEPESYVLCLFPHDVDLFGWKIWKNWI